MYIIVILALILLCWIVVKCIDKRLQGGVQPRDLKTYCGGILSFFYFIDTDFNGMTVLFIKQGMISEDIKGFQSSYSFDKLYKLCKWYDENTGIYYGDENTICPERKYHPKISEAIADRTTCIQKGCFWKYFLNYIGLTEADMHIKLSYEIINVQNSYVTKDNHLKYSACTIGESPFLNYGDLNEGTSLNNISWGAFSSASKNLSEIFAIYPSEYNDKKRSEINVFELLNIGQTLYDKMLEYLSYLPNEMDKNQLFMVRHQDILRADNHSFFVTQAEKIIKIIEQDEANAA